MKYNGVTLVLDNFRNELKSYSIDIQDVIRSAILDGVDIVPYIDTCKNNPYRLDQIRLGMKEGLSGTFFSIKSGESLYKIRQLNNRGIELSGIEKQVKQGVLNEDYLDRFISWVEAGYNLEGINISIIPKTLFESFEQGFKKGFDMKEFNNGKKYSPEYIHSCLVIKSNGKDIKPFISKCFDEDCMKQLASFSKFRKTDKWNELIKYIDSGISSEKLSLLIVCVKSNISISELSKDEWSTTGIGYILDAYTNGVDYKELIKIGSYDDTLLIRLNQMKLNKSKRVSGRLRKG